MPNFNVLLTLSVYLLSIEDVFAACPNYCSGHGSCGTDNTCTCVTEYNVVPDCSQKICPSSAAWADKAYDEDTGHAQAECSNQGTCQRSDGTCQCMPENHDTCEMDLHRCLCYHDQEQV